MNLALIFNLFSELFPMVMGVVHAVQATHPADTAGMVKFNAAANAVANIVTAASVVPGQYATAKGALSAGDTATFNAAVGGMIETAVSLSKGLGIFPKAGIVQAAQPLVPMAGDANALPGAA